MGSKYFIDALNTGAQEVAVAGGADAEVKLTEGSNTWNIKHDGATGRLAVSYNTSEAFAISDDLFPVFPEYTVASLPTGEAGGMIMVTDETGGYVPAFYDGTNWRRVTDRAIVS